MSKKGYFVPLELPKYCNKCVYGCCIYSKPFWSTNEEYCKYDGQINKPNTVGYICEIDRLSNGKYKVMRAKFDKNENLEKPNWCPLKEIEVINND